ncbi:MAG: polyprenyl synthetase family protein, partial [Sulfobacillus sp.]
MGLFSLVEPGLQQVDILLAQTLRQENSLVAEVSDYLLLAGGKRLRPALVLLAGQFGEGSDDKRQRLVTVATAVEMIHMATLVHDDIIDEAAMRRGIPAV